MDIENGYWVDENGNRWDASRFTEEQAQQASDSLNCCTNCTNCTWCSNCTNCTCCTNCFYCTCCTNCSYCRNYVDCIDCKTQPNMYRTPYIGSRDAQTLFYWAADGFEQVVCGCFRGSLAEFVARVEEVHGNRPHGLEYKKQIEIMKILMIQ